MAPSTRTQNCLTCCTAGRKGNPFFVEEIAYALRDSGDLEVRDGVCRPRGDVQAMSERTPSTVEGVIASRIDRLRPREQLSIGVASVIQRAFSLDALRDVYPIREEKAALAEGLENLVRLGLLEAREPGGPYTFKHAVMAQVAYDQLAFAQRRGLHRAVADYFERHEAANLALSIPCWRTISPKP